MVAPSDLCGIRPMNGPSNEVSQSGSAAGDEFELGILKFAEGLSYD